MGIIAGETQAYRLTLLRGDPDTVPEGRLPAIFTGEPRLLNLGGHIFRSISRRPASSSPRAVR